MLRDDYDEMSRDLDAAVALLRELLRLKSKTRSNGLCNFCRAADHGEHDAGCPVGGGRKLLASYDSRKGGGT